jgi:hypothetical protein
MSLFRTDPVKDLKKVARRNYEAYMYGMEDLDCGRVMAEHLRPYLTSNRLAFNAAMDQLAALDPTAPKDRL